MPLYEKGSGNHVSRRVLVPEGSDDDKRYAQLVADGAGWHRVDKPKEAAPKAAPKVEPKKEDAPKATSEDKPAPKKRGRPPKAK